MTLDQRPQATGSHALHALCCSSYIRCVLLDWSGEFDVWLTRVQERAEAGDISAELVVDLVEAQLRVLQDLDGEPEEDTATLARVRQSGKYQVWRVAHPFIAGAAVRLIVWFPPDHPNEVVVTLFAGDKARMGNVFYKSVGARADAAIESYRRTTER